jgi:hypothetical protein
MLAQENWEAHTNMAKLTELLGNREQAQKDMLEKGRIWVYSDGNMYSAFCNGFCWRAQGCGKVIIEAWGSAGSTAEMCCCGHGTDGNAPAYVKKCICVCPGNYICGYVGRSCNNADDLCFRGCSEATCVCWFGCSPNPLYADGQDPCAQQSWRGNNPWGWGNERDGFCFNLGPKRAEGYFGTRISSCCAGGGVCYNAGQSNGCMCAQGGRGGMSYCMDTKSPFSCFITGYFCGQRVGTGHNMCDTGNSACGRICNWCQSGNNIACAWGGDVNCCGAISCVDFLGCLSSCPCQTMHHIPTAAGVFAEDGAVISFMTDGDTENASWAGTGTPNLLNTLVMLSRQPSHTYYNTCWSGQRSCGCYNMQGCHQFVPYGVPGVGPNPCGNVRDHGMRGGMGMVRIKYVPTDGGNTY